MAARFPSHIFRDVSNSAIEWVDHLASELCYLSAVGGDNQWDYCRSWL
jgi:hypothetical protein